MKLPVEHADRSKHNIKGKFHLKWSEQPLNIFYKRVPVVAITRTMNTIFSTAAIKAIGVLMSFDSRENEHKIHKL